MIKAIVIGDDSLARQEFKALLAEFQDVDLVEAKDNGSLAIDSTSAAGCDLLYLDVDIPDLSLEEIGMDLDTARTCLIVTTSNEKHALRAFELGATDLLLKPFPPDRLKKCIARVRRFLQYRVESEERPTVSAESAGGLAVVPQRNRFVARSDGKIVFFKPGDITWIRADANAVRLNFADGRSHRILQTMHEIQRRLDSRLFLRIHRSIIVNIEKVRDVQSCGHGEFIVTLIDGKELPLGRSYRQDIERLLA